LGELPRHHARNLYGGGPDRPAEQGEPPRVVDLAARDGAALVDGPGKLCKVLDVGIVVGPDRSHRSHVASGHGNALDHDHGEPACPHQLVVLDQIGAESTLQGGVSCVEGRHDEAVGQFLVTDLDG
jgi:hypothetical protein